MLARATIKNTIFSWADLIVSNLLAFILRTFIIRFLGIEVLGVDATIVETVNLLNMLEMGIQTSISYKMYKPIIDGDFYRQSELFNLYKNAYKIIGLIIFFISLIIIPFVPRIVNSTLDIRMIFLAYGLQIISVVIGYFTSYYKLLIFVNQKLYIINLCNIILSIIFFAIRILIICFTKNYILYLSVNILIVLLSWLIYRNITRKEFPKVVEKKSKNLLDIKQLFLDTKEMILIQMSGYVYGSTDNVMISFFFGSILTGYISNYLLIIHFFRNMLSFIGNALSPTWGILLNNEKDIYKLKENYKISNFGFYFASIILLIPTLILIDEFIGFIWLKDSKYIINTSIYILIIFDVLFANLGETNCVIMRNSGLFKEEKIISFFAMLINIIFSVILALFIGVEGIFIGTVISVIFYWIFRSYIVNFKVFKASIKEFAKYWLINFVYIVSFGLVYFFGSFAVGFISVNNILWDFVVKGIIIEMIVCLFLAVFWSKSVRAKKFIGIIFDTINFKRK